MITVTRSSNHLISLYKTFLPQKPFFSSFSCSCMTILRDLSQTGNSVSYSCKRNDVSQRLLTNSDCLLTCPCCYSKMAYAETSRKKQNRNSNSTSPRSALEKPFSNLTLYPGDSSKDGKSLVQRERSPVAGNRYSRYSGSLSATSAKPKASAAQKSTNLNTRGGRSTQRQVADKQPNPQKSVVPKAKGMLAPKGYTMRPIIPAAKAELLPVARAMHGDDFAPRVKKLFDPEREAAIDAIQTGVYIGWRCPEFKHDCIRVCKSSKCFCGHLLSDHAQYTGKSVMVPCTVSRCECKAFAFVPSRPEEAGEFWLQRRPGYDPSTWRAKCKCKHTHEEHHPTGLRTCRTRGCGCSKFFSNFLCAACDRHWEDHETSFETADMRKDLGLPYGEAYLPFHGFPQLRNVVLTGREDDDSQFQALTSGPYAIPVNTPTDLALRLRGANTQNDSFKW